MTPKQELFMQLIRENKGIIYKVSNSYCSDKDDREDLAQEIIYNLWKSFESFNNKFKFSTWMYRVALNVAISFYRSNKKLANNFSLPENLIVFEDNSESSAEVENKYIQLQKFLADLKEMDKSIMFLYLENKSYKEIAEIIGITESNVATKINRIKVKIKSNINHQN